MTFRSVYLISYMSVYLMSYLFVYDITYKYIYVYELLIIDSVTYHFTRT